MIKTLTNRERKEQMTCREGTLSVVLSVVHFSGGPADPVAGMDESGAVPIPAVPFGM